MVKIDSRNKEYFREEHTRIDPGRQSHRAVNSAGRYAEGKD
jgi:hypothetical protein